MDISTLVKIANKLDDAGMNEEADQLDEIISLISAGNDADQDVHGIFYKVESDEDESDVDAGILEDGEVYSVNQILADLPADAIVELLCESLDEKTLSQVCNMLHEYLESDEDEDEE